MPQPDPSKSLSDRPDWSECGCLEWPCSHDALRAAVERLERERDELREALDEIRRLGASRSPESIPTKADAFARIRTIEDCARRALEQTEPTNERPTDG